MEDEYVQQLRMLDGNGEEVTEYDSGKYYLVTDRVFIKHHPKKEGREPVYEEKIVHVYPNGGKDAELVLVEEGEDPQDEYDEYEIVYRVTPYTEKELAERRIIELKSELQETDYVAMKIIEDESNREKYAEVLKTRANWRKEINELDVSL